ncbi:MAG: DNRLRE domain-containing protein, partial [Patescibacteria group bacterium]|nr:DNRLRE domain-containing protein [Patescibacteria group bacterium]
MITKFWYRLFCLFNAVAIILQILSPMFLVFPTKVLAQEKTATPSSQETVSASLTPQPSLEPTVAQPDDLQNASESVSSVEPPEPTGTPELTPTPDASPSPDINFQPTATPEATFLPASEITPTLGSIISPSNQPEAPPPVGTPTPPPADWQTLDSSTDITSANVILGKTYRFRNTQVTVTFTKLPVEPGILTIKEIKLTKEQQESLGALSDTAYDITSNMPDGSFTYDLSLPLPTSAREKDVEVKTSETVNDLINPQTVTQEKEQKDNIITIKNLDHFTIFVLVANPSSITNGMLAVIGDTYIKQDSSGNDNYGSSGTINIYSQSADKNRRILIKFDLSSLPEGVTVNSAALKLKMTNAPGANRQYDVYRITGTWDENTVTWETQPPTSDSPTDFTLSNTTNNVILSWDVASDVSDFLSGTANNGWLIKDSAEDSTTPNTNQASFASKENGTNSNRPQLSVDFSLASPANTSPSDTAGFNSPSAQTAVTNNSGDNDGYQGSATNAFSGDGVFATDTNSGATNNSDCSNSGTGVDRHIFYNYNLSIPAGATVNGIEVRQDLKTNSLSRSPFTCVQLSWDGGTNWTAVKQTSLTSQDLTPYYFGGAADLWSRSWSSSDFSNANFRVRLSNGDTDNSHSDTDYSLDWVPVRIYYTQDTTPPAVNITSPLNGSPVNSEALISFTDNELTNPQCSINDTDYLACQSGVTKLSDITGFNALGQGSFNLYLKDTDVAGNTGTDTESGIIKDTVSPVTSITSATDGDGQAVNAGGITKSNSISIEFNTTDTNGIAGSDCKIDAGTYLSCTSPKSYSSLSDGNHTVSVRSTDTAGNIESTATFTWTVDTTAPILVSKTTFS